MNRNEMIQSVRAEIANLQQVLELLLDQSAHAEQVRRPGRPKATGSRATSFNPEEFAPKKRVLSAEGKARIAEGQKKRWAARKSTRPESAVRKSTMPSKQAPRGITPKPAKKVATVRAKSAGKKAAAERRSSAKAIASPAEV